MLSSIHSVPSGMVLKTTSPFFRAIILLRRSQPQNPSKNTTSSRRIINACGSSPSACLWIWTLSSSLRLHKHLHEHRLQHTEAHSKGHTWRCTHLLHLMLCGRCMCGIMPTNPTVLSAYMLQLEPGTTWPAPKEVLSRQAPEMSCHSEAT